jgi:hypothetical protein
MKYNIGGTFILMGDISVTKSEGKRSQWTPERIWEYMYI